LPADRQTVAITRKLDLRSGRSIWQSRPCPRIPETRLSRDIVCDVLVVGAGISGALIAESLSDAGLRVVVLDRRGAVRGSTVASTALIQYELDTPLANLARMEGRERAERMWRRSRLAVDALRERSRALGIKADQVNRDSLYLSGNVLDRAALLREADARRRVGFNATFLEQRHVEARFGIRGRSALLSYDNFAADPRRLATGFLLAATKRGTRVHAPAEVTEVRATRRGVEAATKDGPVVRCQTLVYATGYEMPKVVRTREHQIFSTWAIATRPQPRALWPTRCFIWEAADPYLYMRVSPDHRVICGGEDEEFSDEETRNALLDRKTASIERKLKAMFPKLDTRAEFAWCGSFGSSPTGMPTIGSIPGLPNCYVAMGYGGNGITFSMMAAQMLRGLITGVGDPDSDLVSLRR
jgi:glycine/D-amino acid oxidase-like deaminating enzyme